MKPQTIGRVLGTGIRVAGRIAGQRVSAGAQAASNPPASNGQPASAPHRNPAASGRAAGQVTRAAARGVGGFLRPFGRVGGILWLEVTGVFFFLFVVVFAPIAWRTRASWASGPDHRNFVLAVVIVAVFSYLGVSSFWRARKK
jgi:hypothetical protein